MQGAAETYSHFNHLSPPPLPNSTKILKHVRERETFLLLPGIFPGLLSWLYRDIYLDLSFTPLWITPVVIITKTQNVFAKDVTLSLLREIICNFCTFSKNCSHLSSPIWLKFGIKADVRVLFMKWILKSSSNVVFA